MALNPIMLCLIAQCQALVFGWDKQGMSVYENIHLDGNGLDPHLRSCEIPNL